MSLIRGPRDVRENTSIIVQTRNGRNVPNDQVHEISAFEKNQLHDYERDYSSNASVTFRTEELDPIYNCQGLTFACRRTGIYNSQAIDDIINDDGYVPVERETVLPGDIVLYIDLKSGDIAHSGIVVSKPTEPLKVPWVVSKWGKYKEVWHLAHVCPYPDTERKYFRVMP